MATIENSFLIVVPEHYIFLLPLGYSKLKKEIDKVVAVMIAVALIGLFVRARMIVCICFVFSKYIQTNAMPISN
jgi:hypothetical protein